MQFIQSILELPALSLNAEELTFLTSVVDSNRYANGAALAAALAQHQPPVFNSRKRQAIARYYDAWHAAGDQIVAEFASFEAELIKNKGCANADNLTPLLIQLLPESKTRLRHLFEQVELAASLHSMNEKANRFITVYSAIRYKLNPNVAATTVDQELEDLAIGELAKRIANAALRNRMNALIAPCLEYRQVVHDEMLYKLRRYHSDFYKTYFLEQENSAPSLLKFLNDVDNGNIRLKNRMIPYINRLRAINTMCMALTRPHTNAKDQAEIFSLAFDRNRMLFESHRLKPKTLLEKIWDFITLSAFRGRPQGHEGFFNKAGSFSGERENVRDSLPLNATRPNIVR